MLYDATLVALYNGVKQDEIHVQEKNFYQVYQYISYLSSQAPVNRNYLKMQLKAIYFQWVLADKKQDLNEYFAKLKELLIKTHEMFVSHQNNEYQLIHSLLKTYENKILREEEIEEIFNGVFDFSIEEKLIEEENYLNKSKEFLIKRTLEETNPITQQFHILEALSEIREISYFHKNYDEGYLLYLLFCCSENANEVDLLDKAQICLKKHLKEKIDDKEKKNTYNVLVKIYMNLL